MNYLAVAGAACLGIVVGWLIRYAWRRIKRFSIRTLAATIPIIIGGALSRPTPFGNDDVLWIYVLGLFTGMLIYSIVGVVAIRKERRRGEFDGILYAPHSSDRDD